MRITSILSFSSYALATLLSIAFGAIYLVRSRFMSYHEEAVGQPWEKLDRRMQTLLIGLMRTTGGGLLAASVAVAILLLIPFRSGESWSRFAVPAIGLASTSSTLYATIFIRHRTSAHTPVFAAVVGMALVIIGAALSFL